MSLGTNNILISSLNSADLNHHTEPNIDKSAYLTYIELTLQMIVSLTSIMTKSEKVSNAVLLIKSVKLNMKLLILKLYYRLRICKIILLRLMTHSELIKSLEKLSSLELRDLLFSLEKIILDKPLIERFY